MLHNLTFFRKNPTYTPLFHPTSLLILENVSDKMNFIVVIFGKFQPAQPYFILCIYQFWEIFDRARLFHLA